MGKAFIELHNTVKKKQTAGSCPPSERRKPAGNSSPRPELLCPEFSYPSPIIFFRHLNHLIQPHGDCAENQDGGDHHIQLEHLAPIDDQIPKPPSGGQEFPDDHAHQRKADVDLHGAQDDGDGAGQDDLEQGISAASARV